MARLLPKTDKDFQALLNSKLPVQYEQDGKPVTMKARLPILRGGAA